MFSRNGTYMTDPMILAGKLVRPLFAHSRYDFVSSNGGIKFASLDSTRGVFATLARAALYSHYRLAEIALELARKHRAATRARGSGTRFA